MEFLAGPKRSELTPHPNTMTPDDEVTDNQPFAFKGRDIEFQNECKGTIADETEDALYIISRFFTGWMYKAEFFDLLGVED